MNREEIIKLSEDNGLTLHGDIEHFAALVASAERKACVEVIKDNWIYTANPSEMVYYILERGQA